MSGCSRWCENVKVEVVGSVGRRYPVAVDDVKVYNLRQGVQLADDI